MTPLLSHARARAEGPLRLGSGEATPAGMVRLADLAVPVWPDGVTPSLLEEHQVAPPNVERSGETRRVLAACLKCCWVDLSADPWPGATAPVELVLDTYRALIGRTDDLMRNWAVGALRRLHDSSWVVMADGFVRLGPRCATWPVESYGQLKELVRRLPEADRTTLTVVGDADLVAAAVASGAADVPATETVAPQDQAARPLGAGEAEPLDAGQGESLGVSPGGSLDASEARSVGAGQGESLGGQEIGALGVSETGLLGGRVETARAEFDDLLDAFDERRRAELVAAFMAVEFAAEPVQEARFTALRDPALRRTLAEMLARRGRTLIQQRERWISGYDDAVAAKVGTALGESERAVLTLVLVHSVAIPRAEGLLPEDTWLSPHATPVDELRRHTQLPIGELESALRVLRHAGLLSQVKAGEEAGGYVPGPQFHRLTRAARRRLQEELILAAGPHTPLAAAVRAQRKTGDE
ncbi:hypothetical protein ACFXJ8_11470 [Nonomuraea sp. NPDC059194]|uniref:hypothetical protein n=1 Tax=Nonomuraea sp. NPDC059194 TaxID=3346764 RepID=UPI0036808B14